MRTTLDLPADLIEEARRFLGLKSKTDVVVTALRELVRRHRLLELRELPQGNQEGTGRPVRRHHMRKEYDFARLKRAEPRYLKRAKAAITMRLDPTVIAYFRSLASDLGMPYQSLINYVLRDYANHGLEPSANWGGPRRRRAG